MDVYSRRTLRPTLHLTLASVLPCADSRTVVYRSAWNPPMLRHNLRILLVEDHPFQLIALQILLNNHELYRLTPALNASEALAALERSPQPYDLLLCDQRLPDMEGIDLIELASHRKLIRHAVLLSGVEACHLLDLERLARERGIPLLGCLNKPLNTLELFRLISSGISDL
jgi:CheY-like chemotaxis protein